MSSRPCIHFRDNLVLLSLQTDFTPLTHIVLKEKETCLYKIIIIFIVC